MRLDYIRLDEKKKANNKDRSVTGSSREPLNIVCMDCEIYT